MGPVSLAVIRLKRSFHGRIVFRLHGRTTPAHAVISFAVCSVVASDAGAKRRFYVEAVGVSRNGVDDSLMLSHLRGPCEKLWTPHRARVTVRPFRNVEGGTAGCEPQTSARAGIF